MQNSELAIKNFFNDAQLYAFWSNTEVSIVCSLFPDLPEGHQQQEYA